MTTFRRRALLALPLLVLAGLLLGGRPLAFAAARFLLARQFPAVRRISTAELAAWRADSARRQPVLLDVRTAPEHAMSHLAGARRVDPAVPDLAALSHLPRDTPIVTYCAVGYRSARLAERLAAAGFTRVWNLEGSLFAWANEGRPMVAESGKAPRVHPYDRFWGLLLRSGVRG